MFDIKPLAKYSEFCHQEGLTVNTKLSYGDYVIHLAKFQKWMLGNH